MRAFTLTTVLGVGVASLGLALAPIGVAVALTDPPAPACAHASIVGTPGDDHLVGTEGPDVIDAGAGDDTVYGLGGDDTICGGPGRNVIDGGDGDDELVGSDDVGGRDLLVGGLGSDTLWGLHGEDDLYARSADAASGVDTASTDVLYGGPGGDRMVVDDGSAQVYGGVWGSRERIVLRGRPGPRTVLSTAATIELELPAAAAGHRVRADLGSGRLVVDGSAVRILRSTGLAVRAAPGGGRTDVQVTGSDGSDGVDLLGVATARLATGAGIDQVNLHLGAQDRIDLDLGPDGADLTVFPAADVRTVDADLTTGLVVLDGRAALVLARTYPLFLDVRGDDQPDRSATSVRITGTSASEYLSSDAFGAVRIDGGRGIDDVTVRGGPQAPRGARAVLDGGPDNDRLSSDVPGATVRGGAGLDRCHGALDAILTGCEVVRRS